MLRKIFGLLIFPILGASVHTYAQEEYDQQIFQYINQEKWFDAKSLYDTRHDDLSEVIRLISGAFLGAYFNRPAEGVAAIEELLAKYGGQLGGQAVMYRMLAAKNFASMRAYAKMDSVFTYMLAYDAPYLDDQTRKEIRFSDRGTLTNLLTNHIGYTLSTGVLSSEMHTGIVSIPLDTRGLPGSNGTMQVGYIIHSQMKRSPLLEDYISMLENVMRDNPFVHPYKH